MRRDVTWAPHMENCTVLSVKWPWRVRVRQREIETERESVCLSWRGGGIYFVGQSGAQMNRPLSSPWELGFVKLIQEIQAPFLFVLTWQYFRTRRERFLCGVLHHLIKNYSTIRVLYFIGEEQRCVIIYSLLWFHNQFFFNICMKCRKPIWNSHTYIQF